jgi:hypothetical protein
VWGATGEREGWGKAMRDRGCGPVVLALLAMVAMALAPAPAEADHSFCPQGSGAGQCEEPKGVAVDAETGHVYVADRGNNRIEAFDEDGNFLATIGAGVLSKPRAVAVDNDPASPTRHDVFVLDSSPRVLRFSPAGSLELGFGWGVRDGGAEAQSCGPEATPPSVSCLAGSEGKGKCQLTERSQLAVGPGGRAYVSDSALVEAEGFKDRIEKFAADGGSCEEDLVFPEGVKKTLDEIAVDSTEGAYLNVDLNVAGPCCLIVKLDSGGSTVCEFDQGIETTALGIDPASDDLLSAQRENAVRGGGSYRTLTVYGPGLGCPPLRRFGYGQIDHPVRGIAPLPGILSPVRAGEPVLSEGFGGVFAVFHLSPPSPGPIIVPASVIADPLSNTKATLGAEINPEGAQTKVSIEYVEEAICKADEGAGGECFEEAQSSGTTTLDPEGFTLAGAEAQFGCPDPLSEAGHPGENAYEAGECLQVETTYRFRALASNADGEGNSPLDGGSFKTRPWFERGPIWSTSVGTGSAALHAELNPLGVPVSARFEVVDDAHFAESGFKEALLAPGPGEAPLDFGKGEEPTARAASLGGLEPGALYHYRLAASNPLFGPTVGKEGAFTTFAAGAPPPCPANEAFRTGPSSLLPDCRAYEMVSPLDKGGGDVIVLPNKLSVTPAALEQSSVSGSRLAYGSSHAFQAAPSAPYTSQYIAVRHERGAAGEGWQSHGISPPIERPLIATAQLESELKALSPDLCDAWLRSISEPTLAPGAQAGFPNLYRRRDEACGGPSYEALTTAPWQNLEPGDEKALELELQGVSADGRRAIYLSLDSFAGTGAPNQGGKDFQLYAWAAGPKPVFACVLPNGAPLHGPCSGGTADGFSVTGLGRFTRLQGALSADGERAFWTASDGEGKLYMRERSELGKVKEECSAGKPCTIAISATGEALSGTTKSRFSAAAADGSKAIFTSGDDLYRARISESAGHPALAGTDTIAHEVLGVMGVSEDASHVYFAAKEAIAGAGKNSEGDEAVGGQPNLYLYREGSYAFIGRLTAQEVESGHSAVGGAPVANLARVAPDGEHAAFVSIAPLTGYDNADAASGEPDSEVFLYNAGTGRLICASCNPSGARPAGRDNSGIKEHVLPFGPAWIAAWLAGHETSLYASRELADDGRRLFFNSADSLVARDTNGRADVYEWEAPGSGTCTTSTPTFSPRSEGCIDLISSGQSAQDSEFLDASPSGQDVFFITLSSLLSQDPDLVDVYDARVDGGFRSPPAAPRECEGEACQGPPTPPGFPTPASSAFEGPEGVGHRCHKGKRRVRRAGKTRCVKKRHRSPARRGHRRHGRPQR